MEFHTAGEEATYSMLRQALRNQITTHTMAASAAFAVAISLVSEATGQMWAEGADIHTLFGQVIDAVKQELRTRQGPPALPLFVYDGAPQAEDPISDEHVRLLSETVDRFMNEAGEEHRIPAEGGVRIAIGLLGDLLHVLMHQGNKTLEEIDEFIEHPIRPALANQLLSRRWQAGATTQS